MLRIAPGALVGLHCGLAAADTSTSATFNKAAVKRIAVALDEENLDGFGFTLPRQAMAERMAKNLAEWHFPMQQGADTTFSHTLHAQFGRINHKSTPVGFSFTSGNSDPRAQDFQKADVLPVVCRLVAKQDPQQFAEYTLAFSAGPFLDVEHNAANQAGIIDKLTDQISTACFTLLDDLQLSEMGPASSKAAFSPGWMPSIRVEVLNEETDQKQPDGGKKPTTEKISDKKIIIHNQGTPVILKLGHDRL